MPQLKCHNCSKEYHVNAPRWRCDCGGLLDIIGIAPFDRQAIEHKRQGLWRYRNFIPLEKNSHIVTLGEGMTPLIPLELAGRTVLFKMDHLFPTGSFKDRGATVMISKIKELGIDAVVEDSSGNAGAAIAAYCAAAGIACDIFVPAETSTAKTKQITAFGARLHRLAGGREATAQAALAAAADHFYASHTWHPFFFQGTKTVAYELCEQLNWKAPDWFVVPVGNGTLLYGVFLGFSELAASGVIEKIPKLLAVQAAQCAPLAAAFYGTTSSAHFGRTQAEGIAVTRPPRGEQILAAVRTSGGDFVTVSEQEIGTTLDHLYKRGLYIEPTAAAAPAAIIKSRARFSDDETIASVFTGHGLKHTF